MSYLGKKRFEWVDSIKGIFIFLVVLGHSLAGERACEMNIIGVSHYLIYSVHMPFFILISGLLSKEKISIKKAIRNYLIPYILFDTLYTIWQAMMKHDVSWNILFPTYVYWYILALFFMRLLLSKNNGKVIPIICIVLSLFSVLVSDRMWTFLSFGRVILLYPVFYIGYLIPLEGIEELKSKANMKILLCFCFLLCIAMELILLMTNIVSVTWATHDYSPYLTDYFIKWVYMFVFTLLTFGFLTTVIPSNKICFINRWGKNSIVIYLIHPFFVDIVKHITNLGGGIGENRSHFYNNVPFILCNNRNTIIADY